MKPQSWLDRFPTELDDKVLGDLEDDPKALRKAALVCRRWLAVSRVYLYRDVRIETEDQYKAFEHAVTASPLISRLVYTLRLDRRGRSKYELNYPWVNLRLSPNLPRQLTNLRTLILGRIEEKWDPASFKDMEHFSTVEELVIVKCAFSPAELLALIGSFRALRHLTIENYCELFHDRERSLVPAHRPVLTSLQLDCDDIRFEDGQSILDWLASRTDSAKTLTDVGLLVGSRRGEIEAVGDFLRHLGPVLENLELSFQRRFGHHESQLPRIYDALTFGENTGLKTFILDDHSHPAVSTLLARIDSPRIETVILRSRLYTASSIARIDHAPIARAFEGLNLERLNQVKFEYYGSLDSQTVEDELRKVYPSLAERKIMKVVFCGEDAQELGIDKV